MSLGHARSRRRAKSLGPYYKLMPNHPALAAKKDKIDAARATGKGPR